MKTAVHRTQPPRTDEIYSHLSSIFTEKHGKKENTFKEDIRGTAHTQPRGYQKRAKTQQKLKLKQKAELYFAFKIRHLRTLLKSHLLYLLYHTVIQTLVNCRITSHAKHLAFPYGGPKFPHRIKVGHGSSHVNYVNHVNNSVVNT